LCPMSAGVAPGPRLSTKCVEANAVAAKYLPRRSRGPARISNTAERDSVHLNS
jgi:hypothetical protein